MNNKVADVIYRDENEGNQTQMDRIISLLETQNKLLLKLNKDLVNSMEDDDGHYQIRTFIVNESLDNQNKLLQKISNDLSKSIEEDNGQFQIRTNIVDAGIGIDSLMSLILRQAVASIPAVIVCALFFGLLAIIGVI